jgi:hypothetical protein
MRFFYCFIFFFLFSARVWPAEADHPHSTVDFIMVRGGEQLQSPHIVTYRLIEWEQMRGRWIGPDIGYYDTGYGNDQIWFTGAGAALVNRRHFYWEQELYITQEAGPESHNRRSLWIWPVVDLQFRPRLSAQIVAYPTIPLTQTQRWGYDVDRAKLERTLTSHWLAGVGYSGGICSDRTWQSRPFLTATRKTRLGNVEMWLQSIPGGSQAQVRYLLVRKED